MNTSSYGLSSSTPDQIQRLLADSEKLERIRKLVFGNPDDPEFILSAIRRALR